MPELPEVETVRLQLLHKIIGKTIRKVEILHPKTTATNPNFAKQLKSKTLTDIERVGKLLIFKFENTPDLFLLGHLKMTGQFIYRDKIGLSGGGHSLSVSDLESLPGKHTRVTFHLSDDTALYFNDMRLFGYLKLVDTAGLENAKARFGQEPISDNFNLENFLAGLKKRRTPIKAVLLDQTFIAGLGNIYVDETLFLAGVKPTRSAHLVTRQEARKIAKFSGQIMQKAISVGGTTFQHFADTGGKAGNYSDHLKIFGKQNMPCLKCKKLIIKIRLAGRGTHFCPTCQK